MAKFRITKINRIDITKNIVEQMRRQKKINEILVQIHNRNTYKTTSVPYHFNKVNSIKFRIQVNKFIIMRMD